MKIFSVGQVNNYIKNIITQDYMLKSITIKGEVSNCKYHSLGHIYFSLKDETGSLPAVMFKGNVSSGLGFTLKDGQAVIVSGSIGVYERDGRYQLYASSIKLDGAGKLYEELEKLKYKLNEEGLFDFDNKKPIPQFPKKVGIVTAKTGAAIQDIMNIARRRNPYVQLILYPAKVQGEGAADTIVKGIEVLDSMDVDTIIVGRGGGSIEDLWAFNERIVAEAIYNSQIPVISAVGHEVDFTIADFVADKRAATPTAAAELATPSLDTLKQNVNYYVDALTKHIKFIFNERKMLLGNIDRRLENNNPLNTLKHKNEILGAYTQNLNVKMNRILLEKKHLYDLYKSRLDSLNPLAIMDKGYSINSIDGEIITDVKKAKVGQRLQTQMKNGILVSEIIEVKENGK